MPRQQTRVQQRKIKPKQAEFQPPVVARKSGALQARMLEGHSPARIIRLTTYLAAYQAVLLLLAVLLAVLLPPVLLKVEDVLLFIAAIVVPGALVWPATVLALRDRKATPELIQGQMVGASPVSTIFGLGMLYLNTRQSKVQLNVERRLLKNIPQNQVQVAVRVSPNLRHVSTVQVIGPRIGSSVPNQVPEKFRQAERFPLYAIGGAYAGVFGLGMIALLALLPIDHDLLWLHLLLVPAVMMLAAVAARFATQFFQKKLEASLQP
ncbi:MAG: hypothetical protein ACYDGR_08570 [Candidatus Dormibacteria bacterium]